MNTHSRKRLIVAAVAAFSTYFCMYAFRKPFTAGTFDGQQIHGHELKSVLVIAQLCGYMLSKFIGIKVVSEMPPARRAIGIVGLILAAELALVGFALVPLRAQPAMLFLNGFPLGMIFGLVLAYLEGRRHTEALSATLCASFIISSGVVKSVGRILIEYFGVSETTMPMLTGLLFLPPLLISVWLLQQTPPPDDEDRRLRTERKEMSRADRNRFLAAYWPGLILFVFVYVLLTIVRTVRDDFGVEIWRDLGVQQQPSVFAISETFVAVVVTVFSGAAVLILHNLSALRVSVALMCGGFGLIAAASLLQGSGVLSPFTFMVTCGVGMYIPYVAFHTTVFERLVAASRHPGNLAFLMYLADAIGYLGYAGVLILRSSLPSAESVLPFFRTAMIVVSCLAAFALLLAWGYFHRTLQREQNLEADPR